MYEYFKVPFQEDNSPQKAQPYISCKYVYQYLCKFYWLNKRYQYQYINKGVYEA